MTPERLLHQAIVPALTELTRRGIPDTVAARRLLLAIALQESRIAHRRQVSSDGTESGPAVSYWQGELGGGMCLTLKHRTAGPHMKAICALYDVEATPRALWEAMRYNDIVAAAAARMLIYTLPKALPMDAAAGWDQYLSAWRPGKPHPEKWAAAWNLATLTVGAD